ncbi:alveolar macrophage chemotactic factor-like [Heterodontus francisci]|uniref:alveolar macrophage chemotactic factor-like n=1 Tax=Heterodontus francisci TaxID=7792 RepID=UPI00355B764D
MKPQTVFLLLTIVICLASYGLCIGNTTYSRCKCVSVITRFIQPKNFEHIDIFPQGSFCRKVEIVITMKNGKKICVSPQTQWVKKLVSLLTEKNEDTTQSNANNSSTERI